MDNQPPESIPMAESQKCSFSPPPPYPTDQPCPYPPTDDKAGAIGLDRPIGSTVSPPPPYPSQGPPVPAPVLMPQAGSVQVLPPYPIQQQPKPQKVMPAPYPPVIPMGAAPLPSMIPLPAMAYNQQIPPVQTCQPGSTTIILNQAAPRLIKVGPKSVCCQCPNCNQTIYTKISKEPSDKAMCLCVALCLAGCDAGCCLIPFFIDSLKDVKHKCPRCKYVIGQYKA